MLAQTAAAASFGSSGSRESIFCSQFRAGIDAGIDAGAADKAVKRAQVSKSALEGVKNWLPKHEENPLVLDSNSGTRALSRTHPRVQRRARDASVPAGRQG